MAIIKQPSKKKNGNTSLVKMSRMDFEIARFAFEKSTEIGLAPTEVSFLLGKKDAYFFDLLNPTDKNKFKTEQPDLLPAILDRKIRQIIPNDVCSQTSTLPLPGLRRFGILRITKLIPTDLQLNIAINLLRTLRGKRRRQKENGLRKMRL